MKNLIVLGKNLENVLSDDYIVTSTLCDRYSSFRMSTMSSINLSQFIDTESEYSVSILPYSKDCTDPYYNLEIRGTIVLDGFVVD